MAVLRVLQFDGTMPAHGAGDRPGRQSPSSSSSSSGSARKYCSAESRRPEERGDKDATSRNRSGRMLRRKSEGDIPGRINRLLAPHEDEGLEGMSDMWNGDSTDCKVASRPRRKRSSRARRKSEGDIIQGSISRLLAQHTDDVLEEMPDVCSSTDYKVAADEFCIKVDTASNPMVCVTPVKTHSGRMVAIPEKNALAWCSGVKSMSRSDVEVESEKIMQSLSNEPAHQDSWSRSRGPPQLSSARTELDACASSPVWGRFALLRAARALLSLRQKRRGMRVSPETVVDPHQMKP